MRIRIVGDGTFRGTRIVDERGHRMEMVTAIEFKLDRETQLAEAKLTFSRVPVDIDAEVVDVQHGDD